MTVPSSFSAAFIDGPGQPTRIGDHSFSTPLPADELTIRITATAINPADWKIRDSGAFISAWPKILGSDAAGEVVEVGADYSSKFQRGGRVFFQGQLLVNEKNTFQQYCRVPGNLVGRTPQQLSDDEVASVSLGTVTAAIAIYHPAGRGVSPAPWSEEPQAREVGQGKAVVVLGGSTSVGQYAIQLARLSGYSRIVTSATAERHSAMLKKLGAHVVLDRKTQGSLEDYVEAVGDEYALDWVFDCVDLDGSQLLGVKIAQAVARTTSDAVVVSVEQPHEEATAAGKAESDPAGGARAVGVRGIIAAGYWPDFLHITVPMYEKLRKWLEAGEYVPNRVQVVPGGLNALDQAMEMNKAGVSGVKIVIRPHEAV